MVSGLLRAPTEIAAVTFAQLREYEASSGLGKRHDERSPSMMSA